MIMYHLELTPEYYKLNILKENHKSKDCYELNDVNDAVAQTLQHRKQI